MKKFITSSLLTLIGMLIDSQVFEAIKDLVRAQFDTDKSGAEKKAAVDAALNDLTGDVANALKKTSGFLVNLAIEGAVTYLLVREKK